MQSKLDSVRVLMKENHVDLIALGPGTVSYTHLTLPTILLV